MQHLAGVLLAGQLLDRVAGLSGVSANAVRVLGLVAAMCEGGRMVRAEDVARMWGVNDAANVRRWGVELTRAGMLERSRRTSRAIGWRVLPAGERVLGLLEREERATRRRVKEVDLAKWPRTYTKSEKWHSERAGRKVGASDNAKANKNV